MIKKFILSLVLILCLTGCSNNEQANKSVNEISYSKEDVKDKVLELEEKYDINFYYGNDSTVIEEERPNMIVELETENGIIMNALLDIESIMEKLPIGFIEETKSAEKISNPYSEPFEVFDIYLCNNLRMPESDGNERILEGKVITYRNINGCAILIDIHNYKTIKETFSHELFHLIERRISSSSFVLYKDVRNSTYFQWDNLNPASYNYLDFMDNEDEIDKSNLPYTIHTESDINNVYFVSNYANENSEEDLAETFSYLLSTDMEDNLPKAYNSPHVKKKVEAIIKMIEESYTCVDDNAYWTKIYREKM